MGGSARTRLAALVVLVVVAVPLVILVASGSGEDAPDKPKRGAHRAAGLRVERSTYTLELIVYVKPAVNVASRVPGRRSVVLRCVDADGAVVQAQDEAWPFGDTDKGTLDPHAHMSLDPLGITSVERCLLEGTEPLLEGPVP